jgi:hypothetical protein
MGEAFGCSSNSGSGGLQGLLLSLDAVGEMAGDSFQKIHVGTSNVNLAV